MTSAPDTTLGMIRAILTFSIFVSGYVHAVAVEIPTHEEFSLPIVKNTEFEREDSGTISRALALKTAPFRRNISAQSTHAIWGKFSYSFAGTPEEVLLSLRDRRIRKLEIFVFADAALLRQRSFDAAGVGGTREIYLSEYLVSLPARAGEVIFRIEADIPVTPDPYLISWQSALGFERQLQIVFGIFFGAQAILLLLSLFLFAALKETHYLYYALYNAGWLCYEIAARHFLSLGAFYEFMPENSTLPLLWIFFAQGFLLLFARRFLGHTARDSLTGRLLLAAAAFAFVFILITGLNQTRSLRIFAGLFSAATTAYIFVLAMRSYTGGMKSARFFIPAFLAVPLGIAVYAGMRFNATGAGRLADFLILDFMIPVIVTLTAIFLGAAMADRYRFMRDEAERREREFAATLRDEKQRINAELHDVVGSDLATLALRLSAEGKEPLLTEVGTRLGGILNRLREMVLLGNSEEPGDLLPEMTERLREVAAFAGFSAGFEGEGFYTGKYEAFHLRRFFYEALTNAAKHAEARDVKVRFRRRGNRGTLIVADNGRGFDRHTTTPGAGLGNLGERARRLNGNFRLISRPGRGTVLALRFPL